MTTDLFNKNNSSNLISKMSSFKYRDNFFKSRAETKLDEDSNSDLDSPKNKKIRKDFFGNEIKKRGNHKISFLDKISKKKLVEIHNIEKHKNETFMLNDFEYKKFILRYCHKKIEEYNKLCEENKKKYNDKVVTKCETCNIF